VERQKMSDLIKWFKDLSMQDVAQVGGKNASLGEMISNLSKLDVLVPNGFATTATAYDAFLEENSLQHKIMQQLEGLDESNLAALQTTGKAIRDLIMGAEFSPTFKGEVEHAYNELVNDNQTVAVRSSATAEDLPEASFAGQQETLLNVSGIDDVFSAIKLVFASLFNDRAIVYRKHHGFAHHEVKISAGIQIMVRSDIACSGVMFSIDPESGFDQAVFVTGAYGLGETVVQGSVNPDEFYLSKTNLKVGRPAVLQRRLGSKQLKMVYGETGTETISVDEDKQHHFVLTDGELETLGRYALSIESHYKLPMDIEWAKDGQSGELFIVQARPETVQANKDGLQIEQYQINSKDASVLVEGRSVGDKVGQGRVIVLKDFSEMDRFTKGDVLVADMTDPDWEPIMAQASAIVTNRGGRTCHAAIIARELGIPAVVGCGDATQHLKTDQNVTVSCAEGDSGFVYEGMIDFDIKRIDLNAPKTLPVDIMMNLGNPDRAFSYAKIPHKGVGLARLEFIINNMIGIHPNALLQLDSVSDEVRQKILARTVAYGDDPKQFYIEKIVEGITTIAASVAPHPVIVRMSDFKSNEYASLIGGATFEPEEENPMIGYRGASRYISSDFREAFSLECQAIKKAREQLGFSNIKIMVPFVRTVDEGKQVIDLLKANGLVSGENGLEIYMMCEVPSNALLADEFLQLFDGFSIGSNDLTQLSLGLDRDSSLIADQFDERNAAVKKLVTMAIEACQKHDKYVGICGQGPSDHPDFAEWLIERKIKSMSLNPDSILPMYMKYA
jgi:pyruvate,water dikinase